MERDLVDCKSFLAVIEPSDSGEPYVTLFRDDEGVSRSFPLDCDMDGLTRFAYSLLLAIDACRKENAALGENGVDNGKEVE